MPASSWEATEDDRKKARMAIEFQLFGNDLIHELHSAKFKRFIDNQVEVVATLEAQARFYKNVVNKDLNDG